MAGEIRRTSGLPVGLTSFDLSGVLRGTSDSGFAGAEAAVRSHIAADKLAFLRGAVGYEWDAGRSDMTWEVLGGVRWVY